MCSLRVSTEFGHGKPASGQFLSDDEFSALYLCDHGAQVNVVTPESGDTALHLAAKFRNLRSVAEKLLSLKADPNAQNDQLW